jgi:Ran GTPase-activating protein (RanGAP) involved in mRNA processing and transport
MLTADNILPLSSEAHRAAIFLPLLEQVKIGNYFAFRHFIGQQRLTSLDLSQLLRGHERGALQHLGQALHNMPIEKLDISNNALGPAGIGAFMEALRGTQIKSLNLAKNNLQDQGVAALAQFISTTAITHLELEDNQIAGQSLVSLAQGLTPSAMQCISLCYNPIPTDMAVQFLQNLANSSVKTLSFEENNLMAGDLTNLHELGQALAITPINAINLSGNELDAQGITAFLSGLNFSKVTYMNLSCNNIGGVDISTSAPVIGELAKALSSTSLVQLDISANNLIAAQMMGLGQHLVNHFSLKKLFIGSNQLGTSVEVESALRGLASLTVQELDLSDSYLQNHHVEILLTALKDKALYKLNLADNLISNAGVTELLPKLATTQLVQLNVDNRDLTTETKNLIQQAMQQQKSQLMVTPFWVYFLHRSSQMPQGLEVSIKPKSSLDTSSQQAARNGMAILMDKRLPNELFCKIFSYLPLMGASNVYQRIEQFEKILSTRSGGQLFNLRELARSRPKP